MNIRVRRTFAVLASAGALLAGTVSAAQAAPSAPPSTLAFERGPAPTDSALKATRGPFAIAQVSVSDSAAVGFGAGTIYYPTDTSQGTFGGIAVSPGFTSPESAISWVGPRLASHGFVVFTISTNNPLDQPNSRGQQLLAALDHLTTKAPAAVQQRLDPSRLAVMGHSMGGGGSVYAINSRKSIKAAVPMAPYHSTRSWPSITSPVMVLAGTADTVASPSSFAKPIYNGLTGARERAYVNFTGASHGAFTSNNGLIGKYAITWMKRFVDDDTRYNQFLCPASAESGVTEFLVSCPVS